jgi:UPF0755 protein
MKKLLKTFLVLMIVLGVVVGGGFIWAKGQYDAAIKKPLVGDAVIELEVAEGESFSTVLEDLDAQGKLTNKLAVKFYLRQEKLNPNVKFGSYQIPASVTLDELIALLEKGQLKPAEFATIKEGLTYEVISESLDDQLEENTVFSADEFKQIAENPDNFVFTTEVQSFLDAFKPEGKSLEGFIFPDTYRIDTDMNAQAVIELILTNFQAKLEENNITPESGNEQIANFYEALTLASIIEKEASKWDDRSEIASVFTNRLAIDQALGSDATINFITGKNDAGVTLADRDIQSPYNTYLNIGLPPTPIDSPRLDSILAAINPKDTNYLYFYHTPDGKTFFNTDFGGHSAGVCRDLGC